MLDEKKIKVRCYAKIQGLLWRSSPRLKSGGFRADCIFMKAIFCICISFICFILPSKKLKEYCEKLGEKTFVIAESNENWKESIAVQILY